MPFVLKKPEPYVVTIDDTPIRLHIAEMRQEEYAVFQAQFLAFGLGRTVDPVADDAPASVKFAHDVDQRRTNAAWIHDAFARYITVESGDFVYEGETVTAGDRFLDLVLRSENRVISDVLSEIYLQNSLTPAQKKTLQSRRASLTGSAPASSPAAPGPGPVPPVTSADARTSAAPAAVTEPSSDASSGATAPSSSRPAPFGS